MSALPPGGWGPFTEGSADTVRNAGSNRPQLEPAVDAAPLEALSERRLGAPTVLLLALVMIAGIGVLDHVTGIELRLYPLYVAPVAMVSWRNGARAGLVVSLLALSAWALSNHLAGLTTPTWAWVLNSIAHLTAFAVVVTLVASLQRSQAAERRLARTDSLTGLLNSRAFYLVTAAELERQRRYRRPMTLAFVDLDNFKQVNDRHGHTAGDRALSQVAKSMQATARATDVVARLGGDEFALLLPETDREGAHRLLERLSAAVAQAMAAHGWPVTCSVGAVTFDTPPEGIEAVVTAADQLMYRVKNEGKSAVRVEPFTPARGDLLDRA